MGKAAVRDFFFKPFVENFPLLLCIWVLASSADCYFWTIHGNPVFGAYMAVHGFIQCYFIILPYGLLKGIAAKLVKWILIVLGYVNMAADAMVHNIMHFSFTGDVVAIIMGSNASEATEFLPMYLTPNVLLFIGIVIAVTVLILLFADKLQPIMNKWGAYCAMAFLIAGMAVVTIRKSNNWEGLFLNKIGLFLSYDSPVDLIQYRTSPDVTILGEQPDNIVVIIGESLSRNHCSLYGYEKHTQPLLEKMLSDSLIRIHNNVYAAFPSTVGTFKAIMSTYKSSSPSEDWFSNETFLFDAMKAGGYDTYWISNQSSVGLYDNIVAKFAQLADSTIWVGTKGMGIGKHDLDELVLPVAESVKLLPGKKFIVIHLMGSHEGFEGRYPQSFAGFKPEDYADKPENQRWTLSAYDNSILYNDFIVSSLFKEFADGNNVVIYFPDHALDIFDTDPEYAGHARPSEPESLKAGTSIPFIISSNCDSSELADGFNTENLFDYLLNAANIEMKR